MTKLYDFGFTHVDEPDKIVLDDIETLKAEVADYKCRLDKMYQAMIPLLSNLKSNPDKDMIHWPNRGPVIDGFVKKLDSIKAGEE